MVFNIKFIKLIFILLLIPKFSYAIYSDFELNWINVDKGLYWQLIYEDRFTDWLKLGKISFPLIGPNKLRIELEELERKENFKIWLVNNWRRNKDILLFYSEENTLYGAGLLLHYTPTKQPILYLECGYNKTTTNEYEEKIVAPKIIIGSHKQSRFLGTFSTACKFIKREYINNPEYNYKVRIIKAQFIYNLFSYERIRLKLIREYINLSVKERGCYRIIKIDDLPRGSRLFRFWTIEYLFKKNNKIRLLTNDDWEIKRLELFIEF